MNNTMLLIDKDSLNIPKYFTLSAPLEYINRELIKKSQEVEVLSIDEAIQLWNEYDSENYFQTPSKTSLHLKNKVIK